MVERGAGTQDGEHSGIVAVINREWFLQEAQNLCALVCPYYQFATRSVAMFSVRSNNAGPGHGSI